MTNTLLRINFAKIINISEKKIEYIFAHNIILIGIIMITSLIIRLVFLNTEVPIKQDANAYFWYAMDMSILGNFPYSLHANDGWPIFLSIFFGAFHFNNYHDYITLQRIVSISVSLITIIPIYFLSKKFVDKEYAVLGTAIFAFEPHIIQNSLLGITEPLYLFLATSSIVLFLSSKKKIWYSSFVLIALSTIVRAEGIAIFGILLLAYFLDHRKEKGTFTRILFAIMIFSCIFAPMMLIKIQTSSGISSSSLNPIIGFSVGSVMDPENSGVSFSNFEKGIETMIKRLGQSMIPYFAFFVPFGTVLLIKNRNKENNLIILLLLLYSIVIIRVYFAVSDLRMIFFLYPLFMILSLFTIKHMGKHIEFRKLFLISLIGAILLLSWFYLYNNSNTEYDKEVIQFAKYMISNVSVSNNFYPESGFIYGEWANNLKFPILSSDAKYTGPELLDYVKDSKFVYLEQSANSVQEYISLAKNQGLTHIVIDNNNNRPSYFKDVFYNEEKYPYLIKEFDSVSEGYKYYFVKVFRINYNSFESIVNTK